MQVYRLRAGGVCGSATADTSVDEERETPNGPVPVGGRGEGLGIAGASRVQKLFGSDVGYDFAFVLFSSNMHMEPCVDHRWFVFKVSLRIVQFGRYETFRSPHFPQKIIHKGGVWEK